MLNNVNVDYRKSAIFLCSLALEFVYDKVIHINENYITAKKHAQKKRPF